MVRPHKKAAPGKERESSSRGCCFSALRTETKGNGFWAVPPGKAGAPFCGPRQNRGGAVRSSRFFSFLYFSFLYFTFLYFTLSNSVYKKGESADRNRVCVDRFTHLYIKFGKYFHSISRGMIPRIRKKRAGRAREIPAEAGFPQLFTAFQQGFPHAGNRAKKHRITRENARFRAFLQTFRKSAARGFTAFSAGTAREKDQSRPKRAARCRQTATAPRWWETGFQSKRPRRGSTPPR